MVLGYLVRHGIAAALICCLINDETYPQAMENQDGFDDTATILDSLH